MARIALNNLTYSYPQAPTPILEHVNLTLPSQQFTLLTGPSGTGKSTLLQLMAGGLSLADASGSITFDEPTSAPLTDDGTIAARTGLRGDYTLTTASLEPAIGW